MKTRGSVPGGSGAMTKIGYALILAGAISTMVGILLSATIVAQLLLNVEWPIQIYRGSAAAVLGAYIAIALTGFGMLLNRIGGMLARIS